MPFQSERPNYILNTRDIDGAYPRPKGWKTTRVVNPLEPEYQLPKVEEVPPPEIPFKGDRYHVDDIEGTKATPLYRGVPRNNLRTDVIQPSPPYQRKVPIPMDVNDIVNKPQPPKRMVDPNDPHYESLTPSKGVDPDAPLDYQGTGVIGPVDGSKPRYSHGLKSSDRRLIDKFDVRDIGATPAHSLPQRAAVRNLTSCSDIDGASPKVPLAWRDGRHSNPLNPDYGMRDQGLGDAGMAKREEILAQMDAEARKPVVRMVRGVVNKTHSQISEHIADNTASPVTASYLVPAAPIPVPETPVRVQTPPTNRDPVVPDLSPVTRRAVPREKLEQSRNPVPAITDEGRVPGQWPAKGRRAADEQVKMFPATIKCMAQSLKEETLAHQKLDVARLHKSPLLSPNSTVRHSASPSTTYTRSPQPSARPRLSTSARPSREKMMRTQEQVRQDVDLVRSLGKG
ncbi:Actin related protein 5 [Carpediemonas membranifera]|uniref:Actin related protein 5 n=1 Tax=Carpediemonas membranifera TaxID=201153 RepID=A0A8J6E702_9EUKA|nr:Actin related protein 5 [Carpediemonas membranifera]|eukprot:KAG9390130.1 Actin related protein 5 [Carpediemonas membranifera]